MSVWTIFDSKYIFLNMLTHDHLFIGDFDNTLLHIYLYKLYLIPTWKYLIQQKVIFGRQEN